MRRAEGSRGLLVGGLWDLDWVLGGRRRSRSHQDRLNRTPTAAALTFRPEDRGYNMFSPSDQACVINYKARPFFLYLSFLLPARPNRRTGQSGASSRSPPVHHPTTKTTPPILAGQSAGWRSGPAHCWDESWAGEEEGGPQEAGGGWIPVQVGLRGPGLALIL